jgi:hypothetical protein
MATQNNNVAAERAAGASGAGPATEQPLTVPTEVWRIVEKGILASSFSITIRARQAILISSDDVEVEIDHFGLGIRTYSYELIIDPRYNVAELRKNGKLVAVSSKVKYIWIHGQEYETIYEAKDFANLIKKSVKELIEEAINLTAFDVV